MRLAIPTYQDKPTRAENVHFDFCADCAKQVTFEEIRPLIGSKAASDETIHKAVDEFINTGAGCEHPSYQDAAACLRTPYYCFFCDKKLDNDDD